MSEEYYGIHELAKIFQITPEAIRKYEEKGIIKSIRDEQNSYRRYSAWELFDLLYLRSFRAAGFSLNQTKKLTNSIDPALFLDLVEEQQQAVLSEIENLKRRLLYLNQLSKEIAGIIDQGEALKIETLPETAFFPLMYSPEVKPVSEDPEERKKWLEAMPFTSVTACFLDKKYYDHLIGLSISTEDMHRFGLETLKPVRRLPASLCFTCVIKAGKDTPAWSRKLNEVVKEIEDQGYSIVGTVIYKGYFYGKSEENYSALSKYYLPVTIL